MKKIMMLAFAVLVSLCLATKGNVQELRPVASLHLFGGAERGNDEHAGGIGGSEILGLYPFSGTWGLQGSLLNQGGNGGYRFGLSAGPVYAYGSGKVGLFGDYVHKDRGDNNFFYLRGVWAHYFQNFDLVLSYLQPAHPVQHTRTRVVKTVAGCPVTRFADKQESSINELKAVMRYYPNPNLEFDAGLLVNSFAGPGHNDPGTGFGGVFGLAFQALDWLIIRPVQGQMDTRERYRVTSGVEFVWTPVKEKRERLLAEGKETLFAAAPASAAAVAPPPGC